MLKKFHKDGQARNHTKNIKYIKYINSEGSVKEIERNHVTVQSRFHMPPSLEPWDSQCCNGPWMKKMVRSCKMGTPQGVGKNWCPHPPHRNARYGIYNQIQLPDTTSWEVFSWWWCYRDSKITRYQKISQDITFDHEQISPSLSFSFSISQFYSISLVLYSINSIHFLFSIILSLSLALSPSLSPTAPGRPPKTKLYSKRNIKSVPRDEAIGFFDEFGQP